MTGQHPSEPPVSVSDAVESVIFRWWSVGLLRFNSHDDGGDDLLLRDEIVRAVERVQPEAGTQRDRLRDALQDMAERWENDAEFIEGAAMVAGQHGIDTRPKRVPKIRRDIAAEAIRSSARELRELLADDTGAALTDPTPEKP